MEISLYKANLNDAAFIYDMQVRAFSPTLEKYKDYATSPANETVERLMTRINQSFTDYYIIKIGETAVGGIRIVKMENNSYRISPIFILPEHQGKGIAQKVFAIIEQMYDDAHSWELDTIKQEQGNCYLYEKLGYRQTGETKEINEKMTIVYYVKPMPSSNN
jgi:GNAT superfamily N-acetyltransferase